MELICSEESLKMKKINLKGINLKNINYKSLLIQLIADCVGSLFIAASIYVFAKNANFAPGGINGASVIINYIFSLPIGMVSLFLNIPIIIISYKFLGIKFLLKSLKTMIISAAFMDYVAPLLPSYAGNQLLAALFAGGLAGVGYALIYTQGSSTGGSDFILLTIKKLMPHISIGQITQLIDGSIIVVGGFVFGIDAVLYGIVYTLVSSIVMDKIMYGTSSGKLAFIITEKASDICKSIDEEIERGSTIINAIGSYSKQNKEIVMCACSKSQVYPMKAAVKNLDSKALVIITEYNETYGQGFLDIHKE